MRAAFTALWGAIIMILEGVTEFASAFKGAGAITNSAVSQFAEEEKLRSEALLANLSKELAATKRAKAKTGS